MTFEIGLQEFKLTDVLQFVLNTKKTGVVHVEGEIPGEIYFTEGLVVHAVEGSSEGIDAIFNMSATTSGTARFTPDVESPKTTISEGTGKLVKTVERRSIEFQTIKTKLPPMASVWAKTTKDLESAVALRRTDWQVLAMIDGKRDLTAVVNESKLGGFEAMKTIVWLQEQGLIYEPEQMARTMSRLVDYMNSFFAIFGRNGLIWFKRWSVSTDQCKRIARAINIDEETMEVKIVSELNGHDTDHLIRTFEEIVNAEGPKIYGKLLFKKKFQDFTAKLKDQG